MGQLKSKPRKAANSTYSLLPPLLLAGVLRMFTPATYIDNITDWKGTGSGYTGKIDRSRRPFKDNYVKQLSAEQIKELEEEAMAKGENPIEYINNAAERVVKVRKLPGLHPT